MTILITGANRGIGRALFDRYAAAGLPVVGTTRGALPSGGDWLPLDVADPEAQCDLAGAMRGKAIDLLICNAGVYLDKGETLPDGYPAVMWAETFAVNVTGVFLTVQTVLPMLKAAEKPRIAVISSIMASDERAPGGALIYRSSKAAVLNLGRNLARDLAPEGIAVGIYHPGWVRTDMGSDAADISVEQSADGLLTRFDMLSLETTGCFLSYDGTPIPF